MLFIQVIFSSSIENKAEMEEIREIKREQLSLASGPVKSKMLDIVSDKESGFSFIMQWNNEDDFDAWFKEIHVGSDGHAKTKHLNIEKTIYRYYEV
ncbi:MAG: hypothetical protein GX326_00050 [Clostridiaceae bacterium]|nr:hypothetical protein [Clostridiaceae bacterium]